MTGHERQRGGPQAAVTIVLLTGGSDKPYAAGLAEAISSSGVRVEFVGSDELDCPEITSLPGVTFFNLRGDQREDAPRLEKVRRIVRYYWALTRHAARTGAPVLHILWNNKFELFDRTLLMAYYRLLGRRVVMTVHNVNTAARDGRDSWMNRASLLVQYRLCDHLFVHTAAMKKQLVRDYGIADSRVTVVPFGVNDTIPRTAMTATEARARLGLSPDSCVLLFFGQIAPYKGLQYLVDAMSLVSQDEVPVQLVIAGKVKRGSEDYWQRIEAELKNSKYAQMVTTQIGFVPDDRVETLFKAADAVVLPYVDIFQSGVPFLAFSFGTPVIATDVGELRDDVTSATGLLCQPSNPCDLARAIGDFCRQVNRWRSETTRCRIRAHADEHHSWARVAQLTRDVYAGLAARPRPLSPATTSRSEDLTSSCRE